MNSAAVIGRQLRQQAVTGRSTGPSLQTQIPFGKNRPRAPLHASIPLRPYSPVPPSSGDNLVGINYSAFIDHSQPEPTVVTFPIQMPSNCLNVTSRIGTGGSINAVVLQREQRALTNQLKKSDLQQTNPKLRCTWHCFCIAFKALSGGIVLLIVGAIMSVFGFLMESEQKNKIKLNTQSMSEKNEELSARIRNLTYAGPVIMGLGGIVIVAALVLTFEVRDTLGIKEPAIDQKNKGLIEKKKNLNSKNLISVEKNQHLDNQEKNNEDADKKLDNQNDNEQVKQLNENKTPVNEVEKQLDVVNKLKADPVDLPMQVCTIENEMRKLSSTYKKDIKKIKTPHDTLHLTTELNTTDNNEKKEYEQSRSHVNHINTVNEILPWSMCEEIVEANTDQCKSETDNLTTEHLTDEHLIMSCFSKSKSVNANISQQIYSNDSHSSQYTPIFASKETSNICSLDLTSNENKATIEKTKNICALCSCSQSFERNDKLINFESQANTKKLIKPRQFASTDLYYHFEEQHQKMHQQSSVQQHILLRQQKQSTNFIQKNFEISHPHSVKISLLQAKVKHQQPKPILFNQIIPEKITQERTVSLHAAEKLLTNSCFFDAFHISKSISTNDLTNQKSKSLASIESNYFTEKPSKVSTFLNRIEFMKKQNTFKQKNYRPLRLLSKSLDYNLVSANINSLKTSSVQNLEFNIDMSKPKKIKV